MFATSQFLTQAVAMPPVTKAEVSLYQKYLRLLELERVRCVLLL